jgi:hypothetical protein
LNYSIEKRDRENEWPGTYGGTMAVQTLELPYSESAVQDLRERLARTRWPDTIPGSGWEYGFDLGYLKSICQYWREKFDWKAELGRLARLNHLQFTTGDQSIHCVHQLGCGPAPIPILLLHGWPGSFLEMLKLMPRLTHPAEYGGESGDSFDVVVVSLPGFGFSSRPRERGMNTARMSDLFAAPPAVGTSRPWKNRKHWQRISAVFSAHSE